MEQKSFPLRKIIGVPLVEKSLLRKDDGTLIVRGFFTSDQQDEHGDIITRAATERAVPKYRRWGNIRYMHLPKPVAKVVRIGTDDGLEWNEIEIKVIDPQTVFEVENGLLSALSVGILIKWDDIEEGEGGSWIINDYLLGEISLVDHPANYDAVLSGMKDVFSELTRSGRGEVVRGYLAELQAAAQLDEEDKDMGEMEIKEGVIPEEVLIEEVLTQEDEVETMDIAVQKSPACRQEDETVADCVERKIPEILDENPDMEQDQAVAIAHSMCEDKCSESDVPDGEILPATEEELSVDEETDVPAVVEDGSVEEEIEEEETPVEDEIVVEEAITESEVIGDLSGFMDKAIADAFIELATQVKELTTRLDEFQKVLEAEMEAPAEEEQIEGDELDEVIEPEEASLPADRKGGVPETVLPSAQDDEPEEEVVTDLRTALRRKFNLS